MASHYISNKIQIPYNGLSKRCFRLQVAENKTQISLNDNTVHYLLWLEMQRLIKFQGCLNLALAGIYCDSLGFTLFYVIVLPFRWLQDDCKSSSFTSSQESSQRKRWESPREWRETFPKAQRNPLLVSHWSEMPICLFLAREIKSELSLDQDVMETDTWPVCRKG